MGAGLVLAVSLTASIVYANSVSPVEAIVPPVPVQFAPTAERVSPRDGTPDELLQEALARLGSKWITKATLKPVDSVPTEDGGVLKVAGWRLDVDIAASDLRSVETQRGLWEGDLLAGTMRDALSAQPRELIDYAVYVRLPDGSRRQAPGNLGNVLALQSFPERSDTAIRSDLDAVVAASGLLAISVDVVRVDGPAPAVVARAKTLDDAQRGWSRVSEALFTKPSRYEAAFFVVLLDGKPVVVQSLAARSGVGRAFVRDDVQANP